MTSRLYDEMLSEAARHERLAAGYRMAGDKSRATLCRTTGHKLRDAAASLASTSAHMREDA